jgi:hypothetical protein
VRWFKHQTAAHNDAKMKRLIMRQGMAAYGLYWYCLELIGKDVSESRLTFVIEEDSELLAHATGMTREQVEQAMRCMVDLGLFENVEGKISCLNMLRHMDASMFKAGEVRDRFQKKKTEILTHQERDALAGACTVHVPAMYGTSTVRGEQDRTGQDITDTKDMSSPNGDNANQSPIPYKKIQDLYNDICVPAGLSACKVLNSSRKAAIRQRHTGPIIKRNLDTWGEYFQAVTTSRFLTGKVDGNPWRADFDFVVSERGITRTFEGRYHRE